MQNFEFSLKVTRWEGGGDEDVVMAVLSAVGSSREQLY